MAVVVGAAVVATVGTVVGVVAANAAVLVSSAGLLAFAHISAPHSATAMTAAAAIQSFFPDFFLLVPIEPEVRVPVSAGVPV